MLLNLTLRNFKIWETTGFIRLAPVTLLLGTNSSGKSSIIQSLLLIRQTVRNKEPNVSLHFGVEGTSDSVALGQFDDVLCRHGSSNEIEIEFTWSPSGRTEDLFTFSGTYKKDSNGAAVISQLRLGQGAKAFTVSRQAKGAFKLTMGDKRSPLAKSRDLHPQNSFTFSASTLAKLPAADSEEIREAGSALLEELERIIYLGPVRQLAKRHYVWDGVPPSSLGDDGERAIDALIASGLVAKKGKSGGELFIQTSHWLSQMGLAAGLDVKRVGSSLLHELVILGENQSRSNIKDVGVGVSQVLPVIVACLFAPSGHTVIVEEPESHLHPLAQSTLAELFIKVSKQRNIQIIAETHSEHLFRRMQTLIAKEEIPANQCAPYFVERMDRESRLQPLELDIYGRIKNWPKMFFGDSLGETKAQTDLMLAKLKEQKNNNAQAD
jgi:hypothetical protein